MRYDYLVVTSHEFFTLCFKTGVLEMSLIIIKPVHLNSLINYTIKIRFKSTNFNNREFVNVLGAMPRSKNRDGQADTSVNHVALEVLGNSSKISPCGISLNMTGRNYLFNCGEGLQKVLTEYKIKPSKYQNIFITYPSWKNIAGLIGLSLSLQEANVTSLSIHGHSCLGGLFNLTKKIVNFKGIKLNLRLWDHNTEFSDGFIRVKFIHLNKTSVDGNKCSTESAFSECDEVGTSSVENNENPNLKEHSGNFLINNQSKGNSDKNQLYLGDTKCRDRSNYAVGFIIHTQKSKGVLCPEKCMTLGVPFGPLLGKLKNGEDVQLENGNIIKSSDVKSPDLPGVIIIVVECPTEEYLDSLINEPEFLRHQSENIEHHSCAVVHFSNLEVVKSKKYQEWINRFHKDTKHIFVNEASEIGGFVGLHRHQYKLNMVHEEIFPPLHSLGIPDFPRNENCNPDEGHEIVDVSPSESCRNSPQIYSDKVHYKCQNNMHINGETFCEILMKPKKNYDYTKCLALKKNQFLQEVLEVPNFMDELDDLKKKIQCVEKTLPAEKKIYPKIVFLGTGSKKPSKTRNVSGILVFLDKEKSIILDCGENTYYQLVIFFGKQKTAEILRNLGAIFISHLHIDHHMGLVTLLKERKCAFDELDVLKSQTDSLVSKSENITFKPLNLIAPVQLEPWLHYLKNEIFDFSDLYRIIPCAQLLYSPPKEFLQVINSLNLSSLQTAMVRHASHSFGISMTHKDNWKLTYSGDTKPCQDLIAIGKGSDVLIHEATFDDIYEAEAAQKLHSTTKQAILVGIEMNAKFTLLTHFSQRYSHIPVIKNELLSKNNVGIAFDFMQISLYQLPLLPHLYEPLKLVFNTYQEKLEHEETMLKIKKQRNMNFAISEIPEKIRKKKSFEVKY